MNQNVPPDSLLAVPVVEHAVRLVAPVRLRSDITLLKLTKPYSPAMSPGAMARLATLAQQRPVFVMFVHRRDWTNELMQHCIQSLAPEAEWRLDGAPVLSIYRYRDSD